MCVRVVHMSGVDLNRFQFDFDMTWAAFFLNADLTIYGRYGSRRARGDRSGDLLSFESLKRAMERALELRAQYPGNKQALEDKQSPPFRYKTPERIPGLPKNAKNAKPPGTCVHCHHIPTGVHRTLIDTKQLLPDDVVWVYPLPENVGVEIDVTDGRKVSKVIADSPAAEAGVRAGDEIVSMEGQPILSIADIQWVLHNAPSGAARMKLDVLRDGKPQALALTCNGPWKQTDLEWRASTGMLRPGLKLAQLGDAERRAAGIPDGALALRIERLLRWSPSKQSGFKRDDIIIELDGKRDAMNESQFVAYLRQNYKKGARVKVVLRGGKQRVRKVLKLR